MIYSINLERTKPEILETPVAKTFGLVDMYRDFAGAVNQQCLEQKLSKLESLAGGVIGKIRKAFEAGEDNVWITRSDRDVLRKFLFIMKYRGSGAHKRYSHQDADSYSEDDKHRLLEYMEKRGFKKPVDVWFDNIHNMLDLKIDPEKKWMSYLMDKVYPDDAKWFIAHSQMMYLALCTPSKKDDEFLLTENAYSIHEGPMFFRVDPITNEEATGAYTELHVFAVISPKLMMVLRSFILPVIEEDDDEETRTWREEMHSLNAVQYGAQKLHSILEDLPITKARNSYTKLVNGRIVPLDRGGRSPRLNDKFSFRFFPISTDHTQRINSIMLDNSYSISRIAFKSQSSARITLEYYLRTTYSVDGKQCRRETVL